MNVRLRPLVSYRRRRVKLSRKSKRENDSWTTRAHDAGALYFAGASVCGHAAKGRGIVKFLPKHFSRIYSEPDAQPIAQPLT